MQRQSVHLLQELQKRSDLEIYPWILKANWEQITGKATAFFAKTLWKLPSLLRDFKPDIVLCSSMVTAGLSVFFNHKDRQPKWVTVNHGQDVTLPNILYQFWVKQILKNVDATISVSNATRQQTVDRGMNPDLAFVISNGFYAPEKPDKSKAELKATLFSELGLEWHLTDHLLLSVGRQVKRKGHEWFIRNVVPMLSETYKFVLIGAGSESEAVKRSINEMGLANRVFMAGRQSEQVLNQAYWAADAFVMPNIPIPGDMEGFGIVLIEANATETPVVASALEGMVDVISNGKNGYLCPAQDANKFREAVIQVCEHETNSFPSRVRQHAIQTFSWEIIATKYVQTLRQLIP